MRDQQAPSLSEEPHRAGDADEVTAVFTNYVIVFKHHLKADSLL